MPLKRESLDRITAITGGNLVTNREDMEPYSHDEYATAAYQVYPAAVVKPGSTGEVAAIVRYCAEVGLPLTARGGGTGLSAGCTPHPEGIVLSLERLNRIVDVDVHNLTITVEAGVTLNQLYQEVEKTGLFFPPHPGDEGAFVGGTVATNAGGSRAVKYGTIKRFVLGLEVVLASGEIVALGGKYVKSSTGYCLLDLMIGSEGTLGIITQVTLALVPRPASVQTLVVPFESISAAIRTVPAILQGGIVPCAVEFVEHSVIAGAERLLKRTWPTHEGTASLMIILDGPSEEEVLAQAEKVAGVVEAGGALDVLIADQKSRQAEILELRSMLYEALRPGTVELFDVCVPRSEIAGHVEFIHELEKKVDTSLPTYGHAADGNIHTHALKVRFRDGLLGEEQPGWEEKHRRVREEIYQDAIRRQGIISGEHGIGLVKKEYLLRNLGPVRIELMRAIKKALDPQGILNPGKIFD